jgi:hypothetical protein
MKRVIANIIAGFIAFLTHAQDPGIAFIDSLANRTNPQKTIVLFTDLRDTTDDQTGRRFTQRTSYFWDWLHMELRSIEVYSFDKVIKKRAIERAFRKRKAIPPATHIVYTFFGDKLVKVKRFSPATPCEKCFEEYYFVDNVLISKTRDDMLGLERKLVDQASFYLKKIEIPKHN